MTEKGPRKALLIIEDDPGLQSQLRWCFSEYAVSVAEDRESALHQIRRNEPPVVTLDLGLPPDPSNATEGLATLKEIMALAPETKVIVVTGNDEREYAVRAVGMGAYDFYLKPVDPEILKLIVDRAYRLYELEKENRLLARREELSPFEGVIAASPEMTRVCDMIRKVAPTDVSVLLLGESGTGKELLARALHNLSFRKNKRFIPINCAAIPDNLLESELFGYEKGAFTGASKQTVGKIELAHGGTLFLDELGDLPKSLQPKLLRFLQEQTIERLGGREEIGLDVRVVGATHQDLPRLIETGAFRQDLFYRISAVTIQIPPLRERRGDAILLSQVFLHRYSRKNGKPLRGFTDEAIAAIESYPWPGNARELENRIKRAAILADGNVIDVDDLELPRSKEVPMPFNLRQVREEAERQAIKRALTLGDQKVAQAAEMLGISRPTLYALMEKYGLK